ncbi:hypothetical protein [Streptacidiphilus albus]|uniref:hypothetical protein n=1 Tax=Streptacidiphilus albus TaxID=105425 RepID=UPI0006942AF6|nr:hypothetical protein [Streptacidiphilus albus]
MSPNQPPRKTPSGFVGASSKQAVDDILATQAEVEAARTQLFKPTDEAKARGVVVQFERHEDEFVISGDVSRGDAGLVITRAELSAPASTGITHRLLRRAPLGDVLEDVRKYVLYEEARRRGVQAILGEEPAPGVFSEGDAIPQTAGRTVMSGELLRAVSLAYLQETAPGKDPGALQRMSERFERPEGTMRTWITRARKEGWLAPGAKGRMGAEAGPKLRAWVAHAIEMGNVTDLDAVFADVARAYHFISPGVAAAARRLYNQPSEMEFPLRLGVPPIDSLVIAQGLYGRPLSAELTERAGRAGANEDSAFEDIAAEIRKYFSDHQE